MHTKLSTPERLKDLRVVDKHLTLEQLAEQTGLSKSALSKYESDDYKDISPFAITTLAEFYGVSTDYLMGLSENKNHPNTELQAHVTDRTTADPQPNFMEVKEKFDRAMQLGSNEERVIHEFCDQMQIPFNKISSEDFSAFMRILSLSKPLKNPINMRGKARSQAHRGTKKWKKR